MGKTNEKPPVTEAVVANGNEAVKSEKKREVVEVKETTFSGHEAYVVSFGDNVDNVVTKDTFDAIAGYLKKEGK